MPYQYQSPYAAFGNSLATGFNSMMGLARVKMEQQRMQQQQKQQEIQNDFKIAQIGIGLMASDMPSNVKNSGLKMLKGSLGKHNPKLMETFETISQFKDDPKIFDKLQKDLAKLLPDETKTLEEKMFISQGLITDAMREGASKATTQVTAESIQGIFDHMSKTEQNKQKASQTQAKAGADHERAKQLIDYREGQLTESSKTLRDLAANPDLMETQIKLKEAGAIKIDATVAKTKAITETRNEVNQRKYLSKSIDAKNDAAKTMRNTFGIDVWNDLPPKEKLEATKFELNSMITREYPDAKFGEKNGKKGWWIPKEDGELELFREWKH